MCPSVLCDGYNSLPSMVTIYLLSITLHLQCNAMVGFLGPHYNTILCHRQKKLLSLVSLLSNNEKYFNHISN